MIRFFTYFQVGVYFSKEHFKTAIPLATTAMLVMYTLQGSIATKLPTTSYIKFIDIWLLYGLLMPFLILIVIVVNEHLSQKSKVIILFQRYMIRQTFKLCPLLLQAKLPELNRSSNLKVEI